MPITPSPPKRQFPDPAGSDSGQGNKAASVATPPPTPAPPPVPTVTGFFRAPVLGSAAAPATAAAPAPVSRPPLGPAGAVAAAAPRPIETGHFLQRVKLFSVFSFEECQQVVKRMRRRDFPPGTMIVREGAPGNSMFFIITGKVEIRSKAQDT